MMTANSFCYILWLELLKSKSHRGSRSAPFSICRHFVRHNQKTASEKWAIYIADKMQYFLESRGFYSLIGMETSRINYLQVTLIEATIFLN